MNTRALLSVLPAAMLIAATIAATGAAATDFSSIGPGDGVIVPGPDVNPCPPSSFFLNADGSYEGGYAWQYAGIVPPYYGAFAEGFGHIGTICGVQLALTQVGDYSDYPIDVYVWASDGSNPDYVLSVTTGIHVGPPAVWPSISLHDIAITDTGVSGCDCFVGFWGNWPGAFAPWYLGADLDGPDGLPRTNIAPGIGYPSGWQHPSVVWGPTAALGIGAYALPALRQPMGACCLPTGTCVYMGQCECWGDWMGEGTDCDPDPCGGPVPAEPASWGRVKVLYR